MAVLTLTINGTARRVHVDPATRLLVVLSDDLAVRSCVARVNAVAGAVVTLEGLGTVERPHPLQQAFIDEQATQCGFCLSGVILTAKALLDRNPRATDADMRQELSGVLCRCFG